MKQAVEHAMDWISDPMPSKGKEAAMGVVAIALIPIVFLVAIGPPIAFAFGMAYLFNDSDRSAAMWWAYVGIAIMVAIGAMLSSKAGINK